MPDIPIAELMAPLGPFERPPRIAVAVSGGSDSLGLGLLLAEWLAGQGGRLEVLTVDHGLRADSAAECAGVARIFAALPGCDAHILRWRGAKPAHGIQAAARAARYGLMTDWCRAHGVLHLAIAHTADDQAETLAMRLGHGSGPIGLAGMAAARPEQGVRLLRPLLAVPRAAVRDWLRAKGQSWIEDPSNELARFERVRVRRGLSAGEGQTLLLRARQFGATRNLLERSAARLLAEAGQVHEAGFVSIALPAFRGAAREIRSEVLKQLMLCVSGADYPPDLESLLSRLPGNGRADRAQVRTTLGGCLVQAVRDRLCVFREAAAIRGRTDVAPGWAGTWDSRFALRVAAYLAPAGGWSIGPFGEEGVRQAVTRFGIRLKRHPIPLPARFALPALWSGEQLIAQPHFKLGEGLAAVLAPRRCVTTCGFTVAAGRPHTIYSSAPC